MFSLLTDILAARSTLLGRLDARVALVTALALVAVCMASTRWPLPALIAALVLLAGLRLGLPARLLAVRMAAPLGAVAVLTAARLWFDGRAALEPGLTLAARVVGASAVLVLLGSTVPVHRLAAAARWLRVPLLFVELLLLMYRFVFVLLERAQAGAEAQRLRLGWRDRRRALASAGQLSGLVLLRALDQAGRTAEAMRLRAGAGRMPLPPAAALGRHDALALALAPVLVAAAWLACERLP
jgi:cobalt/nickel transport system permease protein